MMVLLSHRIETGLSLLLEQLNNRKACHESSETQT